jgi:hypothetical protein
MAKLTRAQAKAHAAALEILAKPTLTDDDRWAVLENFHEGANHNVSRAGAFFTPAGLASDFAIEPHGGRVIDLCAGIGALAFACAQRWSYTNPDAARNFVCVEQNPAYVEIGRKILPQATWICADVFDVPELELGHFDCAIANPPFGKAPRRGRGPRYSGGAFEYHLIDLAGDLADYGVFIVPQNSAPFAYSGAQFYRETKPAAYQAFHQATAIALEAGCGVDCSMYRDQWKSTAPSVEIVCADLEAARKARSARALDLEAPAAPIEIPAKPAIAAAPRPRQSVEEQLRFIWTSHGVPLDRQAQRLEELKARRAAQ